MLSNPPDIILLTIDCWRADYLGPSEDQPSPTPHIDQIATGALDFRQAITCGGWTRPSLTALLSSTYASMYGGPLEQYAAERPALSEALQRSGYRTAGFTTNPQVGRMYGFDRGFDTFIECEPDGSIPGPRWAKIRGAQRLLCSPVVQWALQHLSANTLPPEVTCPAEQVVEQIIKWLNQPRHQPAFVWAHFMDAHWPYHILRTAHSPRARAEIWQDLQMIHRITQKHGYLNPGPEKVARLKNLYRQALSYVDAQIGRLIWHLHSSRQWDNTVLVVTSDHGEEFYEHGRWSHYQLYDESLRVPLIIRIPQLQSRRVIDRQVSLLDIAPTLLDLAGVSIPREMLGHSLLRLHQEGYYPAEVAVAESMWPNAYRMAMRSEQYKFMYDNQYPDQRLLYDLKADPRESRNIYQPDLPIARRFEELRCAHEELARKTAVSVRPASRADAAMTERLRALGYL
jgi:arylsulfatase A-like enzyme